MKVELDRPLVDQKPENGRQCKSDERANDGAGAVACCTYGWPQKERGLKAFTSDGKKRRRRQGKGSATKRNPNIALHIGGEVTGVTPHPEHHPGDKADRQDRGEARKDRLAVAGQLTSGKG